MDDREFDARKTALSLALNFPGPRTVVEAPGGLEERADRFRAFLMGEKPPAPVKTDAA